MSEPRSKWFALAEWECSSHAKAKPYPREWVEDRWRPLAEEILDVIREAAGCSIRVTRNGGYRCEEHNRAIGGAPASQHVQGRAADIVAEGMTAAQLHELVLRLYRDGRLPKLGGLGLYANFVHVDTRPGGRLARWGGSRTDVA